MSPATSNIKDFDRYVAACDYPGDLDTGRVEEQLALYLSALKVSRKIVRLEADWQLEQYPSLAKHVTGVLEGFRHRSPNAMDAMAARAAMAAMAAMAGSKNALRRFAAWCIQSFGLWSWYRFDLSWSSLHYFGALQLSKPEVVAWSQPLLEAFIAGCWMLHWTEDTLYWVSKPAVHRDEARRLHNEKCAALESDIENLYFWHGVLVPAFVVVEPESITVNHVDQEENAEVRRVMIERMGYERFIRESGAALIHSDEYGALYRREILNDEPLVVVHVVNSTAEPDGHFKKYTLRVHPELRPLLPGNQIGEPQALTARNAIASTFGLRGEEYAPALET